MTLCCENISAINISKIQFNIEALNTLTFVTISLESLFNKKIVTLNHVSIENQLADIFTKALNTN